MYDITNSGFPNFSTPSNTPILFGQDPLEHYTGYGTVSHLYRTHRIASLPPSKIKNRLNRQPVVLNGVSKNKTDCLQM